MLHHHAIHALPLPGAGRRRLVAAVLLQVLDAPLAQLGALILRLDRLDGLNRAATGNTVVRTSPPKDTLVRMCPHGALLQRRVHVDRS